MPLLTIADVAKQLGIHYDTVREYIAAGRLRAIRFGFRRWKIRQEDVDAFVLASEVGPEVGPVNARIRPELARSDRGQKVATMRPHAWRQGFRRG